MFVRQVKRKCSVRGCKNTDCFAISQTREMGNSVIICKSCLEEALKATGEIDPATKSNIPAIDNGAIPPLFFNAVALGTAGNAEQTDKEAEQTDTGHDEESQQIGESQKHDNDGADGDQEHSDGESEQGGDEGTDDAGADTEIEQTEPSTDEQTATDTDDGDTHTAENGAVSCPNCGRGFSSENGLRAHARYCKHPIIEETEA